MLPGAIRIRDLKRIPSLAQTALPFLHRSSLDLIVMQKGFLLGLLAYASFSWGDATIKSLGAQVTVFEIGFFSILSSAAIIFFTKPREERWREFWRMSRPFAVHGRAISGLLAGILGIYAFTTLPLAEAYALIFLSPLFVTILSAVVLKEDIGLWRWSAVFAGIIGRFSRRASGLQGAGVGTYGGSRCRFSRSDDHCYLALACRTEKRTSIMGCC